MLCLDKLRVGDVLVQHEKTTNKLLSKYKIISIGDNITDIVIFSISENIGTKNTFDKTNMKNFYQTKTLCLYLP